MGVLTTSGGINFFGNINLTAMIAQYPSGNILYAGSNTTLGSSSYTFIVPANVFSIAYVVIGGGAGGWANYANSNTALGGAGGGLAYRNNVPVNPGDSISVVVADSHYREFSLGTLTASKAANSSVTVNGVSTIATGGGKYRTGAGLDDDTPGFPAGTYTGGASGGKCYIGAGGVTTSIVHGGGGAAGYTANGGNSGSYVQNSANLAGNAAITGGGGGGGGATIWSTKPAGLSHGGGGGGVNVYGIGIDGTGGPAPAGNGRGGSYNIGLPQLNNGNSYIGTSDSTRGKNYGGLYGGGGGGYNVGSLQQATATQGGGYGGPGAVRIVWGSKRSFPSTNVSDPTESFYNVYL
jgi:hypothetical protein